MWNQSLRALFICWKGTCFYYLWHFTPSALFMLFCWSCGVKICCPSACFCVSRCKRWCVSVNTFFLFRCNCWLPWCLKIGEIVCHFLDHSTALDHLCKSKTCFVFCSILVRKLSQDFYICQWNVIALIHKIAHLQYKKQNLSAYRDFVHSVQMNLYWSRSKISLLSSLHYYREEKFTWRKNPLRTSWYNFLGHHRTHIEGYNACKEVRIGGGAAGIV